MRAPAASHGRQPRRPGSDARSTGACRVDLGRLASGLSLDITAQEHSGDRVRQRSPLPVHCLTPWHCRYQIRARAGVPNGASQNCYDSRELARDSHMLPVTKPPLERNKALYRHPQVGSNRPNLVRPMGFVQAGSFRPDAVPLDIDRSWPDDDAMPGGHLMGLLSCRGITPETPYPGRRTCALRTNSLCAFQSITSPRPPQPHSSQPPSHRPSAGLRPHPHRGCPSSPLHHRTPWHPR